MAKHPVPKQKQSKSRSNRRYKTFQNNARKKLLGMSKSWMRSAEKAAKHETPKKKVSTKVTTIKAE